MTTPSRPDSHVTGDIGQAHAALTFKKWGWTADAVTSDYGEDLDCEIFADNRRTPFRFRCQVKSTSGAGGIRRNKGGAFGVTVAITTARAWLLSYFPVFVLVYDERSQEIYWADASEDLRKCSFGYRRKTVSIVVPRSQTLSGSKQEIARRVQAFYASLLRLDSASLTCELFPVLMPGYYSLPTHRLMEVVVPRVADVSVSPTALSLETAPSWLASVKTLQMVTLWGWRIESARDTLESFSEALLSFMSLIDIPADDGQWIGFIAGPIRFRANSNSGGDAFWDRELSEWWSYCKIGGRVFTDWEFGFTQPHGFVRQVARKAMSWETFHFVDRHSDIAVELFASVPTTVAYRAETELMREHVLRQFLPWTVSRDNIQELNDRLQSEELVFRQVDGVPEENGEIEGVIATWWFEPGLGLFSQCGDWSEFLAGGVRGKISHERLAGFPGREGAPNAEAAVHDLLGTVIESPPQEVMISERHYVPGLPVNHSGRRIWMQRFRRTSPMPRERLEDAIKKLELHIVEKIGMEADPKGEWAVLDEEAGNGLALIRLSVSWTPLLRESSRSSYERVSDGLLRVFDEVLPRLDELVGYRESTFGILRIDGQLYFEEEPGLKQRKGTPIFRPTAEG